MGPAQACGLICVGDVMVGVDGDRVKGMTFPQTLGEALPNGTSETLLNDGMVVQSRLVDSVWDMALPCAVLFLSGTFTMLESGRRLLDDGTWLNGRGLRRFVRRKLYSVAFRFRSGVLRDHGDSVLSFCRWLCLMMPNSGKCGFCTILTRVLFPDAANGGYVSRLFALQQQTTSMFV